MGDPKHGGEEVVLILEEEEAQSALKVNAMRLSLVCTIKMRVKITGRGVSLSSDNAVCRYVQRRLRFGI